jgi:hypothetical protein
MLNHADRHHRQLFDLPAHRLPSRDTLPHGEHVAATAALRPILKNLIDRGERQQIPTVPLMATLSTTPTPGETLLPPPRRRARRIGARWLRAVARTAPQAPLQLRDPLILPGNPISQRLDLRIHTQKHLNDRLPAQRHRPPPPQHTPHRDIRHHQAMPPRPTKRLQKTPPEQGFSATRQERFELPTFGSVDRRSIQLSYWRRTTQFSEHAPVPRLRMRSRGRAPDPRAPQARLRRAVWRSLRWHPRWWWRRRAHVHEDADDDRPEQEGDQCEDACGRGERGDADHDRDPTEPLRQWSATQDGKAAADEHERAEPRKPLGSTQARALNTPTRRQADAVVSDRAAAKAGHKTAWVQGNRGRSDEACARRNDAASTDLDDPQDVPDSAADLTLRRAHESSSEIGAAESAVGRLA